MILREKCVELDTDPIFFINLFLNSGNDMFYLPFDLTLLEFLKITL